MDRYSLNQTQLYALFLFAGTIPVLTLVLGFHLAWQYHDTSSANVYPVIQPEQQVSDTIHSNEHLEVLTLVTDVSNASASLVAIDAPVKKDLSLDEQRGEPELEHGDSLVIKTRLPEASKLEASKEFHTNQAFALQLGAFQEKQRAIVWAADKRLEHDDVHLLKREVNGRLFYTVVVGHFDHKEDARAAQRSLITNAGISSYLIEYRQSAEEIILGS